MDCSVECMDIIKKTSWFEYTCEYAAEIGDFNALQWLREYGRAWDWRTPALAAKHGARLNMQLCCIFKSPLQIIV